MSFIVQLDRNVAVEKIGGKARSLVKLAAAGLPVPPAMALTTELFSSLRAGGPPLPATLAAAGALTAIESAARALREAPWPSGFAEALRRALDALDGRAEARFVVRSSAAIEDRPDALGAGLFLSRLDLPAADVERALREVLASALSPGVVAYLARRSLPTDGPGSAADGLGFAVLIHPFVAGDAAGTAALDSSHGVPVIEAHHGDATLARARIQDALARLTVTHGPVEIEWAATGYQVTFLQLRPYRRPGRARLAEVNQIGLHLGWRWDAAHNPLPLSPAQAGLVALVDRVCDTGLRQQTLGGYLFYAHAPRPAGATKRVSTSVSEALAALRALADARLDPRAIVPLDEALESFLAIYQPLFGVVQPAARAARRALTDFLQRHGIDPTPRLPRLLAAVPSAARTRSELARAFARAPDPAAQATAHAAYLDRFGDESPCWDVAVPTWRETPARLAAKLDRRLRAGDRGDSPEQAGNQGGNDDGWRGEADAVRAILPMSTPARTEWDNLLAEARAAVAAGEDDDALYARTQAHVRRALLREGARLAARGLLGHADDVFWLPLDLVRRQARHEAPTLTREEAARLVDDARRADAAARHAPPSLVDAGRVADVPGLIRGRSGAGGVRIGRVRLWSDVDAERAADLDAAPTVVVARTILPTELPLIAAAALVVETGGPLDHVAAQARERGIPAVVGAIGALATFEEGDQVIVDGDAGLVARID
jgi:phosphohistidine swiveling domain-containing protein